MPDISQLLSRFNMRPPVTEAQIAEQEDLLSLKFPADYVEFLKLANGGEGFIGTSSYSILWGVDELIQSNTDYETALWIPGFLALGSDGGGEAYGFDTRVQNWPMVQVPWIGMDWKEARPVAGSFHGFLLHLSEME